MNRQNQETDLIQDSNEAKQESSKANHAGHRARMRKRFLTSGLEGFASHEVLEFLLFYPNQRRNTNDIAHQLISRFGSLPAVLEASYEELKQVQGVNDVTASYITFLPALFRRYVQEKEVLPEAFDTLSKLSRFCRSLFIGVKVEEAYVLLFDNAMHLLEFQLLSSGTVNGVPILTRKIAELALEKHAACVVITHNHPDGLPLPSDEDILTTQRISAALELFQIPLLEHILVTDTTVTPLIYRHCESKRCLSSESFLSADFLHQFYDEFNPKFNP